jgi:hypothetical protein
MTSCTICFDSFTSSLRKRTTCSYCDASVCRVCIQQYLLMDTSLEPNCPSCRAGWSRDFINEEMTASFRNGPFKAHRQKVLVDRERARLPETQEQAAAYKNAKEQYTLLTKEIKKHESERDEAARPEDKAVYAAMAAYRHALQQARVEFNQKYKSSEGGVNYGKFMLEFEYLPTTIELKDAQAKAEKAQMAKRKPYNAKIRPLMINRREYNYVVDHYGIVRNAQNAPAAAERAVFIQKCPKDACEGFLSTHWKCGICDGKFCKDCHEAKDDVHACNPDLVASVKAIKKEAKPCPKCASQISKIDGCDQMWCTQCKTAFSWNTGKIETHVVHNPHYFQWLRENGNIIPRAPGDAPNPMAACGGVNAVVYAIQRMADGPATNAPPAVGGNINSLKQRLERYVQFFQHVLHSEIPRFRAEIQPASLEEQRRKLRVQRMVQELKEDEWKTILQKMEKDELKARARLQLAEMYATAGMDILGQFHTAAYDITKITTELKALYDFTERANQKTAKAFNCVPLKIVPHPLPAN